MRKIPCPAATQPSIFSLRPYLDALDAIASCRCALGITATTVSVLRALVSFLPKNPESDLQAHLVWPSNEALAERANGMDERTLRRHLTKLVETRLITRNASPNGKRFALRLRKMVVAAFGFDLSPLLVRGDELRLMSEAERSHSEDCAAHKAMIRALLHRIEKSPHHRLPEERAQEIRRLLRCKIDASTLAGLVDTLQTHVADVALVTPDLTATYSQNDRHQQKTEKDSYLLSPKTVEPRTDANTTTDETDISLMDCLEAVSESLTFSQSPVRTWNDLNRLGTELAPMIGIGPELLNHARIAMGHLVASLSVLCVIQKGSRICQPAAYFRRLAQRAETGAFSLKSMLYGANTRRFAAANSV